MSIAAEPAATAQPKMTETSSRVGFRRANLIALACLLMGLLLAWLVYLPGLSGGFLFDDWLRLPALGAYGGVSDLPRLLLYLTSNGGDAFGRPLTLLSFLIDDTQWPSAAYSFKHTSLVLHLLNGILLTMALNAIGRRAGLERDWALRAAVLGALLWLLHPLWVSTTLYIVQRAAIIAATFFLLTLLAWEACWRSIETGRGRRAWAYAIAAQLCAAASVLSKANGVLVPLMLGLVVFCVYQPLRSTLQLGQQRQSDRILRWVVALPAALVAMAVVVYSLSAAWQGSDERGWDWPARVLSQPRILLDYLSLLLLPREGSRGIFADGYALSTSLWSPVSTLPAILLVAGLVFVLWHQRRNAFVALPLGIFLIGHVLESGLINLEPYIEHRNYLPALFLPWAIAVPLMRPRGRMVGVRIVASILLLLFLAGVTLQRASIWASTEEMAALAAARYPESQRAQLFASSREMHGGQANQAVMRLQSAIELDPKQPLLTFNLINATCLSGHAVDSALEAAAFALTHAHPWDRKIYLWLSERIERPDLVPCPGLGHIQLAKLVDALDTNPRFKNLPPAQQDIRVLQAAVTIKLKGNASAVTLFERALAVDPTPDACLWLASIVGQTVSSEAGVDFVRTQTACTLEARPRGQGIDRLHTALLERYPIHDPLRQALEIAKRGEGVRTIKGDVLPAQTPGVIEPANPPPIEQAPAFK